MSRPAQFDDWPSELQPGFGPYRMVAERVVDGDTVHAFVDLGLRQYAYEGLRLEGVDAPEIFSGPPEVREWGKLVRAELARVLPPGTKMVVATFRDRRTFDRYEARITVGGGTVINEYINAWMRDQPWHPEYLAYRAA